MFTFLAENQNSSLTKTEEVKKSLEEEPNELENMIQPVKSKKDIIMAATKARA